MNVKPPKYTCAEALALLKKGSHEHAQSIETASDVQTNKQSEAEKGQEPYAAILSCADSRVTPERIFHAGEGDLFVVRVAGNVSNPCSVASLEYAVVKLKVPVIIVMGHEDCGAVDAAIEQFEDRLDMKYNLNQLLSYIVPAINDPTVDDRVEAIKKNAVLSARRLVERSEILKEAVADKKLLICATYYHVYGDRRGEVEWIGDCKCPKYES